MILYAMIMHMQVYYELSHICYDRYLGVATFVCVLGLGRVKTWVEEYIG